MLELNNSCATLTEYNTAQKYSIVNTIHYTYSQHNITDKEHNTTQNTCRAECASSSANTIYDLYGTSAGSSTNKMHDLQHITHEDTMH